MLNAVNHKINQVLTYRHRPYHFPIRTFAVFYRAYYKFANLHNFGCTFEI